MALIISDKEVFKTKVITSDKEKRFMMIKEPIHQKDIKSQICICAIYWIFIIHDARTDYTQGRNKSKYCSVAN